VGRIAQILSFLRVTKNDASASKVSHVKCNPGGGANVTVEHYADAGDDASPLTRDYVATQPVNTSGGEVALGYADTLNTPKAQPGDKRIYSRDAATGIWVAEVWLKADGSIIGANQNGSFQLLANGDFMVNGLTIDTAGNLSTPGTITGGAMNVELTGHTHTQGPDSGADTQATTSIPL